ncbi:NADH-quinone oxidoreductase subunit A [Candidatus Bathyarchaeota archaeon]|nr:MAG: NADH-quinone oxidoreductase subunit A [Candidatus Bathyarchaeota archaeon]TMI64077.1 MAG: NADH-quinone oxidoreductase subunit A [Candidatus Bathyarchaeota archaeon]
MVAPGLAEIFYYLGFIVVATLVPIIALFLIVTPRDAKPSPMKLETYEAGQMPSGRGRTRFIIQYYPYLLIFVIYDVVAMFLFAWALTLRTLQPPGSGTWPILIFMGVLLVPLAYSIHLASQRDLW